MTSAYKFCNICIEQYTKNSANNVDKTQLYYSFNHDIKVDHDTLLHVIKPLVSSQQQLTFEVFIS